VVAITSGQHHNCALLADGTVKCWGSNHFGELGDGTTTSQSTPISVPGLTDVMAISGGMCAVQTDNTVTCWGGGLGNGPGSGRGVTTPIDVVLDNDRDGCTDLREAGANPSTGGLRNRKSFWDYFDVPTSGQSKSPFYLTRDRRVTVSDIVALVSRFGANRAPAPTEGQALAEILSPTQPPQAPAYHSGYDRTFIGPGSLSIGPPNGSITVQDIAMIVAQFGHSCL
jgi:hypothetical protein